MQSAYDNPGVEGQALPRPLDLEAATMHSGIPFQDAVAVFRLLMREFSVDTRACAVYRISSSQSLIDNVDEYAGSGKPFFSGGRCWTDAYV